MPIDETLDQVLAFDGLAAAEELTGESYKEDPSTEALGFTLFLRNNDLKRFMLAARDDTYFNISFVEALRIYLDEGFQVIYDQEFSGNYDAMEHYVLLWRDGLLGVLESYTWDMTDAQEAHTNKNDLYFNVKLNTPRVWPSLSFSGHLAHDPTTESKEDYSILVGHIDVREGLRHTIRKLENEGTILPKWIEQPFLWLVNYRAVGPKREESFEARSKFYTETTNGLIDKLPEEIRKAICPEKSK